jgi:hypothetical protein
LKNKIATTIALIALIAVVGIAASAVQSAYSEESYQVRYSKGWYDGCAGAMKDGSHTDAYVQGFNDAVARCHVQTQPQPLQSGPNTNIIVQNVR